jgi:hypothetical protein
VGSRLSGFANWNDITVYGYFPYNEAATDLSALPFTIAALDGGEYRGSETTALTDHMVAAPVIKDMSTPNPAGDLRLDFRHLMTAVELLIHRAVGSDYNLPVLKLGSVTFEISGAGGRTFAVSGSYNAKTPMTAPADNITVDATTNKMTIHYPTATNIGYTPLPQTDANYPRRLLVIMPELRQKAVAGFEDARIKMTFHFTDTDGGHYQFDDYAPGVDPSVEFDLSSITNANGSDDNGLLAGYRYAVRATVGTYIRFAIPTTGMPHVNYFTGYTDEDVEDIIDI